MDKLYSTLFQNFAEFSHILINALNNAESIEEVNTILAEARKFVDTDTIIAILGPEPNALSNACTRFGYEYTYEFTNSQTSHFVKNKQKPKKYIIKKKKTKNTINKKWSDYDRYIYNDVCKTKETGFLKSYLKAFFGLISYLLIFVPFCVILIGIFPFCFYPIFAYLCNNNIVVGFALLFASFAYTIHKLIIFIMNGCSFDSIYNCDTILRDTILIILSVVGWCLSVFISMKMFNCFDASDEGKLLFWMPFIFMVTMYWPCMSYIYTMCKLMGNLGDKLLDKCRYNR